MIISETYQQFFTHLWHTEIVSWQSLIGLLVIAVLVAVIK